MATPSLTKFQLPGAVGPIDVDVRTAQRTAPQPAVVVIHGFKGFKDWGMFPPFTERLARAGFTAVSFNLSGSGADAAGTFAYPERFGHNTFGHEIRDLETVLEALSAGDLGVPSPSSVGVVGHSRGGGIAVLGAAKDRRIRTLVTWAAISTVDRWPAAERARWRSQGKLEIKNVRTGEVLPLYLDTLDEIERDGATVLNIETAAAAVTIPWLIIHGDQDEAVPSGEAEALARAAGSQAELLRIEGTGHTFDAVHPFRGMTPALERVFDRSIAFLARHLQ